MRDQLLEYYERELAFIRRQGAEFARKFPKIARRLQFGGDVSPDPHVERLIESFALLAGRIRLKLDDEFPEITESFLNVLYPHYLAPIPSMAVARFELDPDQGNFKSGYLIPRGARLFSRPVDGIPCRFRTCRPVELWPIDLTEVTLRADGPTNSRGIWETASLRFDLALKSGTKLHELRIGKDGSQKPIERLSFYLAAGEQSAYALHEIIFNHCCGVEVIDRSAAGSTARVGLPPEAIRPVGFEADEAMIPATERSFPGYRLLTEYFAFPRKFLFFDVTGLDRAAGAGFGDRFEIVLRLRNIKPPVDPVDKNAFKLGCAPIVNLYEKTAEPIDLDHRRSEYRIVPDIHRREAVEVYSVDDVTVVDREARNTETFLPFYATRHSIERGGDRAFWYATRRPSERTDDRGTEVYLTFVDLDFNPLRATSKVVSIRTTCTNRDLPARLPLGDGKTDFETEESGRVVHIRCVTGPTPPVRPPLRGATQWRLISHLTLNHLSLVGTGGTDTPEALREILLLYDFLDSPATRGHIDGLTGISSKPVVRPVGTGIGSGVARGVETTLVFDEEKYVGGGMFLFASVLERFLGLYVSVNSFSQLVARSHQRNEEVKRWSPRAGDRVLL